MNSAISAFRSIMRTIQGWDSMSSGVGLICWLTVRLCSLINPQLEKEERKTIRLFDKIFHLVAPVNALLILELGRL